MKLLDIIASKLGYSPRANTISQKSIDQANRPLQRASSVIGLPIAPDRKLNEYLDAYHGWVYLCVKAIIEETANIKLTLYKRNSQSEFTQVDTHPVLDLLYKVNPLYTSYLLWEATQGYLELTGEAFWWLVGPKNNPKEIWLLRPDWMVIRDSKSKLIDAYEYGPNFGDKIIIPQEEVVQFKDFNPKDSYRGWGTVKAGAKTIDTDNYAEDYNRNFFFNSAMPAGALKTEQRMTEDQYKRVREDWNRLHQGVDKAGRIAILESGLDWQDIATSHKDMEYLEGRRYSRDEILALFRVPKSLVAITDDVNRANARESRAVFLENVITPKMRRLVSFLNEFLLPKYGDDSLFFDFESPVPNDQSEKLALYQNGLSLGWLSRNEVRELEDRDPVEGGDQLLVPFSMAPIGQVGEKQMASYRARAAKKFNVRIPVYPHVKAQFDQMVINLQQTCEKMLIKLVSKSKKRIDVTKAIDVETVEDDPAREERWKALITRTDPAEAKVIHLLTELFSNQEADVISRLETDYKKAIAGLKKMAEDQRVKESLYDITAVTRDNDIFVSPMMEFLKQIIEAEGINTIQSLVSGSVFFMQSEAVKKYLLKDGAKYIAVINEETANLLRQTLSEGVTNGESIPQLTERVSAVYEDARGYRATRIARTETLRASNFGTLEAYKQSKVVEKKEWLTAKDERVCPWCGPLNGKQLDLQDPFAEKGQTINGKNENGKTMRLTIGLDDVTIPPLHPNCRCTLIPIVSESSRSVNTNGQELLGKLVDATMKEIKA